MADSEKTVEGGKVEETGSRKRLNWWVVSNPAVDPAHARAISRGRAALTRRVSPGRHTEIDYASAEYWNQRYQEKTGDFEWCVGRGHVMSWQCSEAHWTPAMRAV